MLLFFSNLLKLFRNWKYLTFATVLGFLLYTIWEYFTDREVMIWNYGKLHTYIDSSLSIILAVIFPLFITGVIYKWLLFGRRGVLDGTSWSGWTGGIIATIISGASCCGPTLAIYFWLIPLMTWLPYDGLELKIGAIVLLFWANYDLYKNLETCQLQKSWWFQLVFEKEWKEYRLNRSDRIKKWYFLERLHILSQLSFRKHLTIHGVMLYEAIYDRNIKEVFGQCIRLFLVIPWHILQKLPLWNIWTTRVSAFQPMDIPDDLRYIFNK